MRFATTGTANSSLRGSGSKGWRAPGGDSVHATVGAGGGSGAINCFALTP